MRNFGGISTVDAKPAPGGESGSRKPPRRGSETGKKKRTLSTATSGDYPSFNGLRNFGQTHAKPPYKNYGPPEHFRFIRRGDGERLPFYRAPHYGVAPEEQAAPRSGYYMAGIALGAFVLGPLLLWPFVIKGFKPELSYGRRVAIGIGISMGLGAVTGLAKALSKKES